MSQTLKTRSGRVLVMPTLEEDAAIAAGIAADPDACELTDEELSRLKPATRMGRPPAAVTKERITIRLSRDVVDQFRASGDGWQGRVDSALKEWLKTHTLA